MLKVFSLKIEEIVMLEVKQNVKLFDSLDELVDDLTKAVSSNVKLDNVKKLFSRFSFVVTLILFVFVSYNLLFESNIIAKLVSSSTVFVRKLYR